MLLRTRPSAAAAPGACCERTPCHMHNPRYRLPWPCRQLYEAHRESVVQRGVMEYFHISKSGGTSWNAAASEFREVSYSP
jgi:hypothetical protein